MSDSASAQRVLAVKSECLLSFLLLVFTVFITADCVELQPGVQRFLKRMSSSSAQKHLLLTVTSVGSLSFTVHNDVGKLQILFSH